ncbi:molybdopterin-dependent oxidoreductase [Streptomyces sp. NPDC058001]|uniref:molybdopterin-dependent oxidoreductase n=1 Tax=Streptomyces sp. NPDC058001 TaxID=3346300 RepID=UPI0036E59BFA
MEGDRLLPPGQRHVHGWPVSHYGPVPRFRPERWNLRVHGATGTGDEHTWTFEELTALPRVTVVADLHCATGPTSTDHEWYGIPATAVLDLVPPASDVTHVMAWAEYGYAANLRIADFIAPEVVLATHHDGEPLTAEHGFPLRLVVPHLYGYKSPKWLRAIEYLTEDRRGFWEERGYHNIGDPWQEQRYSHQEKPGEGPPPHAPAG